MGKNTIISTVGVSLLGGLKRNLIDFNEPINQMINKIYSVENHHTICAETSSIHSLIKDGIVDECQNLYLLSSDTEEGRKINAILKEYYKNTFMNVYTLTIEHLNGKEPLLFKEEGLKNLVKLIVQIIQATPAHGKECVINATGGYKAQISFAGLIGQVLKIPVYYQFEGFPSVIQLPEIPVSLDYKVWLKHFKLLQHLYNHGVISNKVVNYEINEELKELVKESNGQLSLSSVGLLIYEVLWKNFKDDTQRLH